MRGTKRTGYSRAELDRLYELTDSWTDVSDSLSSGKGERFIIEDRRVFYSLPAQTAAALGRLARRRRTTPERLIERWVNEKLIESRRGGPTRPLASFVRDMKKQGRLR